MSLYDRYTGKIVLEKDLPNQLDFGRFAVLENGKCAKELTYANFSANKVISQDILLEKNKSLQDILIDIRIDIDKSDKDTFEVIPLIRRIKNKLGLNPFENLLSDKIFHVEEIFRQPHYLLKREIEKVHVSRAKRIPSKSYQYLASHTEDWIHKSIVSFKPSRILNEELELNFDVYENQLTISFIERCLVYLNSRIKEVQDIKLFLEGYEKLLKNRDDQKGWYKKIERNLRLIGETYQDEHFHGKNKDGSTLTQTEEKLNQINKRLLLLRKSDLFALVNKRTSRNISLRNTNVLVNHKHYRYVKNLWIELDKVKPEKSESEKLQYEQNVYSGLCSYAKSVISYALKENLKYQIAGNYKSFLGKHNFLHEIHFKEIENTGIFEFAIGAQFIKCAVIGNEPLADENLNRILKQQNMYILYYDESNKSNNNRLININPLDPDSVERMGLLFKELLLKEYIIHINRPYGFKQLLRDYIQYIPNNFLKFDTGEYTYSFIAYPKSKLNIDNIKIKIEEDKAFKTKSRPDKDNLINVIAELVSEINSNAEKLKNEILLCFNCGEKLDAHTNEKLNYLKCVDCGCLLDSSNQDKVILKINGDGVSGLSQNEFGMDYLEFNNL